MTLSKKINFAWYSHGYAKVIHFNELYSMTGKYVDIHTHRVGDGNEIYLLSYSIGLGEKPAVSGFFSAGVHPWNAVEAYMDEALIFLRTAPISAVGEVGLDYSVDDLDKDRQVFVLEEQLKVAQERLLPVVLHCVKAYNDILNILRKFDLKAVVFHGYVGSPQQTKQLTDRGYYISAGEVSLRSPKTVESLKSCPEELLFAETDDSGADIKQVYSRLAEIRGVSEKELVEKIYCNYKKVFG